MHKKGLFFSTCEKYKKRRPLPLFRQKPPVMELVLRILSINYSAGSNVSVKIKHAGLTRGSHHGRVKTHRGCAVTVKAYSGTVKRRFIPDFSKDGKLARVLTYARQYDVGKADFALSFKRRRKSYRIFLRVYRTDENALAK